MRPRRRWRSFAQVTAARKAAGLVPVVVISPSTSVTVHPADCDKAECAEKQNAR